MSDSEEVSKKSGYRLEYSNGRAKCKGPKPCAGSKIDKGQIRVGSLVDFRGNTSYAWRHWGCTTAKIFENMKKSFDEADELDGFEELNDGDKEKVRAAWTAGHVADEDIPATARKADGDNEEEEDEEEEEEAKPKKAAGKKTAAKKAEPTSTVFKFEYAGSARAKCKECSETIGKGFFRLGHEVDFRGNKTFAWQHFGCTPTTRVAQLVQAYDEASAVEGFSTLQDGDKEKVQRAWDAGAIPEDDKGPGEPIEIAKKKAAPRKKKDDDEDRPKKKARKAKADDDEDEDMEEEKPKPKRAPAKKAAEKKEAPAKKRAPRKKKVEEEDEEDAEDFGDELANVSGDDEDEAEPSEDEAPKKRKRAPAKASSSKVAEKPASKVTAKPASKSTKPPSKKAAAKPASSRGSRSKKPVDEDIDEEDDDDE